MPNIVAFGASSSQNSINRKLAHFAAKQVPNANINLLDLNDFEMPLYSTDREKEGIPELAFDFKAALTAADGIIISFAEHNGAYTTAFKNIFDWISRLEKPIWCGKPMFLLSTSTGARGAITVLELAHLRLSRERPNIPTFSLPSFNENYDEINGITNADLRASFDTALASFVLQLSQ
ncbi:MAG: NADPH-dependent FMN reductase [Flavobacteriaceae bacterium]